MTYSSPVLENPFCPKFTSPDFKINISADPNLNSLGPTSNFTPSSLNSQAVGNKNPSYPAYTPPCSLGPTINTNPTLNPYSGFEYPRFVKVLPPFDPQKHLDPQQQLIFELAQSKKRGVNNLNSMVGNEMHFHEPSNLDLLNAHNPLKAVTLCTIPVPKNILNYPNQTYTNLESHPKEAQKTPIAQAINPSSTDSLPSWQTTSRMTQMVDALVRSGMGQNPGAAAAARAAMIQEYIENSDNSLLSQDARNLIEKFGRNILVQLKYAEITRKCLGHRIVNDQKIKDGDKRERARIEADKTHAEYDHDPNYIKIITSTKGLEKKNKTFYYNVDAYHHNDHTKCDKYEMQVAYKEKEENLKKLLHQLDQDLLKQGLNPTEEWNKIESFKFKSTIPTAFDPDLTYALLEDPAAYQALQKVSQAVQDYCKPIIATGNYKDYPAFGETLQQVVLGQKDLTAFEAEHFLEQVCQAAQIIDYNYQEVKTCLGHADYYKECADNKAIKEQSENALKEYEKKPGLQNYFTQKYQMHDAKVVDRYHMYVHYQHVDNYEPCRKYFMQEVAEAVTHPAVSDLEVLKQKMAAQPKVNVADELKKMVHSVLDLPQQVKKVGQGVLQKVAHTCHEVSQVLDQHSMYRYGQGDHLIGSGYPVQSMHPVMEIPSLQNTIESGQLKQNVIARTNQLIDKLKTNSPLLNADNSETISIINKPHSFINTTQINRAIMQSLTSSVHKADEIRRISSKTYPLNFDTISGSCFDESVLNNPSQYLDSYDPSLKAVRSRIKDARGYEQGVAELAYANLDFTQLLADLSIQNCVAPSEQSRIVSLNRPDFKHARIYFTPGIDTPEETLKKNITALSEMAEGYNIYGVQKPTYGVSRDAKKAYNAIFNYEATEATYLLAESIKNYLNEDPNNVVYLGGHSYGAAVNRNMLALLPEELLNRIYVLGVAPAAYVISSDLKNIKHMVSNGDCVHLIDHKGRLAAMDSTTYLDPHPEASDNDHALLSKTLNLELRAYYKVIVKNERNR